MAKKKDFSQSPSNINEMFLTIHNENNSNNASKENAVKNESNLNNEDNAKKKISVYCDEATYNQARELARANGTSLNKLIVKVLQDTLAQPQTQKKLELQRQLDELNK